MGFMDKVKTGLDNTASLSSQKIDEAKYETKVADKKRDIRKAKDDIGEKLYDAWKNDTPEVRDEIITICERIKSLEEEIEAIQKEKEDLKNRCHEEREARRKSAE